MPWKETCVMDQKIKMIGDYLSEEYTITGLSELYEVSRKTIYKWLGRYQVEGPAGLSERSQAPKSHPNATPLDVAIEIVATKLRHQRWGPKKGWWLGWKNITLRSDGQPPVLPVGF